MQELNLSVLQKLLMDRLESLQQEPDTEDAAFHAGTERLLIYLAFDRMRTGEYVWCVKCGATIAATRLLSDPTVLTCVACAAE